MKSNTKLHHEVHEEHEENISINVWHSRFASFVLFVYFVVNALEFNLTRLSR